MRFPRTCLTLAACGLLSLSHAWGAEAAAASPVDSLAARLPHDIGDAARKWLHENDKDLRSFAAFSPADLEREVMVGLASEPAAADFVLGRMGSEPPATDLLILHVVGIDAFWVDVAGVVPALQKLAESTPDDDLVLACLDTARRIEAKRLHLLLTARIAAARQAGDTKALNQLAQADERWVMIDRGASLPAFMRRPPAAFRVKASDQAIRMVGLGDFGTGMDSQRRVAAAIVGMAKADRFDFGLTFGDNFYPSGMKGTDDPRWKDWWEALYGPLGITFHPSLGNHEWYSDDGAAAEIAYRSPTWDFPAPYYTFTAGPVQFFAVDTTEISEAQILWLERAIASSTSRWKVVYGHHPVFAPEKNAKSGRYLDYMQARLWPVLRGRVDAYLCGHQHAMAQMEPRDGVHFFMSGGGGGPLSRVAKNAPGAVFAESSFGFLTLEADEARMKIAIFDGDGKPLDSEVITKGPP